MSSDIKIMQAISEQYGAALKMLENTIVECDEKLWQDYKTETVISQVIYHVLYFEDYYLSKNKAEKDSFNGKYGDDGESFHEPNKKFTKSQLTLYIHEIKEKSDLRFKELTIQELNEKPLFESQGSSILSNILNDIRHIMLHVGALHVRINTMGKMPLRWISKYPEDEGTEKNALANWYLQNGNLTEAEKLYVELCANLKNPLFYYNLACCYARQKKVDQSLKALNTCIQLDTIGRFKESAKTEKDFTNIREMTEFRQVLSS